MKNIWGGSRFYKKLATLIASAVALGALACGGDDTNGATPAGDGGVGDGAPRTDGACPNGQAFDGKGCSSNVGCKMLDCASQGKICEGEPLAACTKCDSNRGYVSDGKGGCALSAGSCQAQSDCKAPEFCLKLETSLNRPPSCSVPPACVRQKPDGAMSARAWDAAKQDCIDCASCVGVTGSTGNLWPVTASGACVCETKDGYYFDASVSARQPRACDADGDGWVENPARDAVYNTDVALRSNAHCAVRKISGFTLRNERGEERPVTLGELGITTPTIDLFEPRALDAQTEFDAASERTPAYGQRRFAPNELNPLTKACVDPRADYNQDGLFDIEQRQTQAPSGADDWMAPFVRLAYFVELNQGYYVPGATADQPGTYRIVEKHRCDAGFLFDYGASTESAYWKSCERRRPLDFSASGPWSDFGGFTCDAAAGTCPVADPSKLFDLTVLDPVTNIPKHASCGGKPSPTFTGMNNESQFRCVQFQDNVSTPYGVDLALTWQANETSRSPFVADLCGIGTAAGTPIPGSTGAVEAPLSCKSAQRSDLMTGQVGWALATFASYDAPSGYVRGCISEGAEWPSLCPGKASSGSQALGNAFDFGNIYCGCGRNFGGTNCEVGCPPGSPNDSQVHTGGALNPAWTQNDRAVYACDTAGYCTNVVCKPGDQSCLPGRNGYWMCGALAASEGIVTPFTATGDGNALPAGKWSLGSGVIPLPAIDRAKPLCDPGSMSCTTGYRIW